jgi:hypothetical protein
MSNQIVVVNGHRFHQVEILGPPKRKLKIEVLFPTQLNSSLDKIIKDESRYAQHIPHISYIL